MVPGNPQIMDYHSPALDGFESMVDNQGLGHLWRDPPSGIGRKWVKTYIIPEPKESGKKHGTMYKAGAVAWHGLTHYFEGQPHPITGKGTEKIIEIPEFVTTLPTKEFESLERRNEQNA
ncbi:hypothetical protein G7Y89_g4800 [Cudoniella acicularis]|uniref:Uncharacterized protein n=1 Tax=Cudoniella acicularis TaxID=354080 RepID=A0A8H4W4L8_9HELO|nr:hypothetical protein G7Y89_g4800 [Cudoniella acicularis]